MKTVSFKKILLLSALLMVYPLAAYSYSVTSPSGRLKMDVGVGTAVEWSLSVDGVDVSCGNRIAVQYADGRIVGENPGKPKVSCASHSGVVPVLFYRCSEMEDVYNSLILKFKGWHLECRAYDQGVAYRVVTDFREGGRIVGETVEFRTSCHKPEEVVIPIKETFRYPYETSFETEYSFLRGKQIDEMCNLDPSIPKGKHSYLPFLLREGAQGNVLLMETDVLDYSGIFVMHGAEGFYASFAPLMADFRYSHRYNKHRLASKYYIAEIPGKFSFPWRIAAWAEEDKDLPTNNLAYLLAEPSRIEDTSWIQPGLTTWDWWNGFRLSGVDFKCGINTDFYKYHIDFAAAHGLKYVVLDEGWYKAPDMMTPIKDVDLDELCRYAAGKNVRLWLWGTSHLVEKCGIEEVFDKYAAMGIAGFKLDFHDGQDQETVRLLTDISESAARHRLMLDFHGCYKPCGLNRTYPNVLNFEGVYGLEARAEDMPKNDVTIPFIRQVAGPLDYTPGAMVNGGLIDKGHTVRGVIVQGTRAHQIGLYLVFDSPFEMMCDSPSRYLKDSGTTDFITSLPTVFDETFVQSGKVGEYIVMVRRNGENWYVGGLTDRTARELTVDFSFLPRGKWNATVFRDGVNADRCGEDYTLETVSVDSSTKLTVPLAPGGGFGIRIQK